MCVRDLDKKPFGHPCVYAKDCYMVSMSDITMISVAISCGNYIEVSQQGGIHFKHPFMGFSMKTFIGIPPLWNPLI